jgi:hypothetical protein
MTLPGLNQSRAMWLLLMPKQAQTPMRSGKVIEGLKQDHMPPHLGALFTQTPALTTEGSQA